MFNKLIKNKKIIYLNLFFIISLYAISFIIRPNLTLQTKFVYDKIPINSRLSILTYLFKDDGDRKKIDPKNIGTIFNNFMGSLIDQIPLSIMEDCPKEITNAYFRDIIIYKFNEYNFSIDIISNSKKETIQKCFETIFIKEFNKFYLKESQEIINKYSELNNWENFYSNDLNNKALSSTKSEYFFFHEYRKNVIAFLKSVNFIVDPNIKYEPIVAKKNISYVVIYLLILIFLFLLQAIYFGIKIFNYNIAKKK